MENIDIISVDIDNKLRLDQYLSDYYEDISRAKISKMIKAKEISVNDNFEKQSFLVSNGDIIKINLDALNIKKLEPQNLDIPIIYQDEDIAIINKPFEIISHPTNTIRSNTVVNFLMYHFVNLPKLNGEDRQGIVHRLDKDTSGLMIVALNEKSMIKLKEMFNNHEIKKYYRAVVNGSFNEEKNIIENHIERSTNNRKLMMVSNKGKYAKTAYKVIRNNKEYSLLNIRIFTGRTHQIRVTFSNIGHPIVGDMDYNNIKNKFNLTHQLLQAYKLEFKHPINNQNLSFEIEPYPEFKKYYKIIFGEDYDKSY